MLHFLEILWEMWAWLWPDELKNSRSGRLAKLFRNIAIGVFLGVSLSVGLWFYFHNKS